MRNNMENRKFVYAFIGVHRTVHIVNYDATNNALNTFLSMFDMWGSGGYQKVSVDDNHMERWFECRKDIWQMLHNPVFKIAFERMGVKLVFDYPYNEIRVSRRKII